MNFSKAVGCCVFNATVGYGRYSERKGWTSQGWVAYIATSPNSFVGVKPTYAVLVRQPAD